MISDKVESPEKKQKTIQKQALQTLKKWCDVSVTKISKYSSNSTEKFIESSLKLKKEEAKHKGEEVIPTANSLGNDEISSEIPESIENAWESKVKVIFSSFLLISIGADLRMIIHCVCPSLKRFLIFNNTLIQLTNIFNFTFIFYILGLFG